MLELILAGGVVVQAAARSRKRRLRIDAYSGDVMLIPGWGATLIDLSALDLSKKITVLDGHENRVDAVLGSGKASVEKNRLVVIAVLADTPAANALVDLLENGVELQASVGVRPGKTSELQPGAEITVNGRDLVIDRPTVLVEAARLEEVSILPLAADGNTTVAIAAKRAALENRQMSKDKGSATAVALDEAAMRANRIRRDGIQASMAKYGADYPDAAEFIEASGQTALSDESWTPADFENLLARETTRCQRLDAGPAPSFGRGGAHGAPTKDTIAAALLLKAGRSDVAVKAYGDHVVQAAENLRCDSLLDIARAGLRMGNHEAATGTREEVIKAAFSTGSLPVGLGDSANKLALSQYQQAPGSWRTFCKIVNLNDFKTHYSIRPHFAGASMPQLAPSGELSHASYQEETFSVNADTFGEILTISRKELINDDLSLFAQFAEALARKAASTVTDNVYTLILSNPSSHFHADNSNLLTGAGSALSISSLSDAIKSLRKQGDVSGKPIDLIPRILLVPPELEAPARQIVRSTTVERDTSSADNLPTGSPIPQDLQLAIEPRLSSTAFTGYSTTAWYLLSGPADAPMLVGFLNGKDGPTIETANADSSVLGIVIRGWIDAGVAMGDFRAAVKSDGA